MRFICDRSLGKLARWLRILGCDTLYYNDVDDMQILREAIEDDRIILTKSIRLYQTSGDNRAFFVDSDIPKTQLRLILRHYNLPQQVSLRFCPICNGRIHKVNDKKNVRGLVPDYTYKTKSTFFQCQKCEKIYWHGSHRELTERFLSAQSG